MHQFSSPSAISLRKSLFRSSGRTVALLATVLLLCSAVGCFRWFRPEVPLGVERKVLENGNIEITVTGKASKKAIEEDSVAMKQTTSREACRLQLTAELQTGDYPEHKERFEIQSVEFLYDFEYCIMKGTYRKK